MLHVQYTHHGPRTISFISPPACLYVLVTMEQFHQLNWNISFSGYPQVTSPSPTHHHHPHTISSDDLIN